MGRVVPVARKLEMEPLRGVPGELWRYRASLSSVADLTSAETLDALGLPTAEPSRDQWPLFQDVGEQLHARRLRRPAVSLRCAPGWIVPVRVPSQRERGIGTTRAARAGAAGKQAAGAASGTADLILDDNALPAPQEPRRRRRAALDGLPTQEAQARRQALDSSESSQARRVGGVPANDP